MPIEVYEEGTGFTKRTRVKISGPLGPEERAEIKCCVKRASRRNDFTAILNTIEAGLRSLLDGLGLPELSETVRAADDGAWQREPLESCPQPGSIPSLGPGERITSGAKYVIERFGYDSREGYAVRFLQLIEGLHDELDQNQGERIGLHAFNLGGLFVESQFKLQLEAETLIGGKVCGDRERERPKEDDHLDYERYFNKLLADNPELSKEAIYERVAARCGAKSKYAVKKALQRLEQRRQKKAGTGLLMSH